MRKSLDVVNETLFPKGIRAGKECTKWSMITSNYKMKLRYNNMYFYPVIIERYMKESSTGKSKSPKYIIEYVKGHIIEVGQSALESGKKIMKAYLDLGITVGEKIIKEVTNYLPTIYNPIRKNFIGETDDESMEYMAIRFGVCETKKEVSRVYKQFAKHYHPDFLGRDLFPHEKIIYQWLKDGKEMIMMNIEQADEFINNIWED